jgi:glycosyltransferase involved in cell wall biosynthesis
MHFAGHHRFFTLGQALATPWCAVPTCGIDWIPTLPPVVLSEWPVANVTPRYSFTTLGNWRSDGAVTAGGVHYGQQAHALRALLELPARVRVAGALEPALAINPSELEDLTDLQGHGWRLLHPAGVAPDPDSYRAFVAASAAEIGMAKSGYVTSRCGWFSHRSACYLASGRPVVATDTGWGIFIPSGEGLLAFADVPGAAAGIEEVLSDYQRHRKAARALAEDVFCARSVLNRLLLLAG